MEPETALITTGRYEPADVRFAINRDQSDENIESATATARNNGTLRRSSTGEPKSERMVVSLTDEIMKNCAGV